MSKKLGYFHAFIYLYNFFKWFPLFQIIFDGQMIGRKKEIVVWIH